MRPLPIALVVTAVLGVAALSSGVVRHRRAPGAQAALSPAGSSAPRPVVQPVAAGQRIRLIAAGDGPTCALYTQGTVACWGRESRRSLGMPESEDAELAAISIPDVDHAVALTVGDRHGCVLDAAGQVACWGYCDYVCQQSTSRAPLFTRATRIEQVPRMRLLGTEGIGGTSCGVGADDDALHCWVEMSASVNWFGDPTPRSIYHVGPERLGTGRRAPGAHAGAVEMMSSTNGAQCTRYADDHVRCWSDGKTDGDLKPFKSLEAPTEPVTSMSGSFSQGCFVLRSGNVECRSSDGVLRPTFGGPARTAAATSSSVCATGRDGSLMCTRYRFDSGDRNIERLHGPPTYTPFRVDIGGPARLVVAGMSHYCALREDDAVYCWDTDGAAKPKRIALELPAGS